jgi:hypothetical protein
MASLLFEMKKQQGHDKLVNDLNRKDMEDLPETRIEMCLKNRALRRLFDKKIKEK